jgi:ABC-type Fe3+-hydroxamate transport system substrate-binding protein
MYLQHDDSRITFLDDYKNYTNKPPEMEGKIINYIGQPYRNFITPHMERLSALFDKAEKEKAEVSDEYGNNVFITQ